VRLENVLALTHGSLLSQPDISLFNDIVIEAKRAAQKAVDDADITPNPFNCGFAWVNISARGNFAKFTKEYDLSTKAYLKGRYIWYSKVYHTLYQDMEIHKVACDAFAKVLKENGIKCSVGYRLD